MCKKFPSLFVLPDELCLVELVGCCLLTITIAEGIAILLSNNEKK